MIAKATGPKTQGRAHQQPLQSDRRRHRSRGAARDRRHGRSGGSSRSSTTTPTPASPSAGATSPALGAVREAAGDRLVVLGTASKSYCMTGWRIGWVLGPQAAGRRLRRPRLHSTQCPATFAQVAAVEALTGPAEVRARRLAGSIGAGATSSIPRWPRSPASPASSPTGGFYFFPNVARYLSRGDARRRWLSRSGSSTRQGVAVVPGEGFGAPGYLRISFARPLDELKDGVRRGSPPSSLGLLPGRARG